METINLNDDARPPNYRATANWLSALTFCWTLPTFRLGVQRDLYDSDLPEPLPEHKTNYLGDRLSKWWAVEYRRALKLNVRPSLGKVIMRCFALEYFLYGFALAFMELMVKPMQPLFLGMVLRHYSIANKNNNNTSTYPTYLYRLLYYNDPNQSAVQKSEAFVFAGGVIMCSVVSCFIQHPYMMSVLHLGMKVRVACTSLIYRKVLRMSVLMLSPRVVGVIINLLSNDFTRLDMSPMFLHYLWISPTQMCLIAYILYFHVQVASFIGICTILVFIPIQVIFALINKHLRWKTAIRTDERFRLMNEIISGIQVIKMYGWEFAIRKLIMKARERELRLLLRTSYIRGAVMSFVMFTARCGTFLTLLAYVWLGNDISSEKGFIVVGYYLLMRQCMTLYFPQGVTQLAETMITIHRTCDVLIKEETTIGGEPTNPCDTDHSSRGGASMSSVGPQPLEVYTHGGVRVFEAYARWGPNSGLSLNGVEFSVGEGAFVAVVGAVGSGKTSLLLAILKELPLCQGYISVKGSVSFAAESPWLFAGTIRQNILFGADFINDRYRRVVKACALVRDFRILPYGDQTFIGERGIALSGGQRARINLARAVYKQASIYLLDNCLAAVDSHVGKHIFDKCISGLLADRVVFLVTHQLQYLKENHTLLLMASGKMLAFGTYQSLRDSGLDFGRLLHTPTEEEEEADAMLADTRSKMGSMTSYMGAGSVVQMMEQFEETRSKGFVSSKIYAAYIKAWGPWYSISFTLFMFVLAQTIASGSDFFMTMWMKMEEHKHTGELRQPFSISTDQCITVYFCLTVMLIIISLSRSFLFFTNCLQASLKLHNDMFTSILHSKMRFFFLNPSGRILNRFSKDMGTIDEDMPYALIDFLQILLNLFGVSIVVCLLNYYLIIPTVVIIIAFYFIRIFYLRTSTNVKRLEAMTRSPIYAHLNASVQGLTTIRAHNNEAILIEEFEKHQDIQTSSWFLYIACTRAFSLWLDIVCTTYIGVSCMSFLLLNYDWYAGEVGLGITQCITLTGLFPWGMRQSAEMENQMTSVERVLEFTRIDQEDDFKSTPENKPRPSWPEHGDIEFADVELYYAIDEGPILRKVTFHIAPREKIGIVGRTGAGKSTLISALFRLAIVKGTILIDHINIGNIGLHDLRKKISIIPQEPVIFSGTMRFNLDPFREFTDAHLLSLLSWVDMDTGQKDSLDRYLDEGGNCLSAGQRQLVCLARALVHNNRILVMDEATANMDPQTDHLIQQTIRTKFAHCTVLTIAHRLLTIMDSDRVMVLDAGRIIEFDHPYNLLNKPDGVFAGMVNQAGKSICDSYQKIARDSYVEKYGSLSRIEPLPKPSISNDLDDDDDDYDNSPRPSVS